MLIPKKVSERFNRNIGKFQKILQIAKDRDVNESDTVSIVNDMFGEIFGYDKYLEVTSEFAIRGTYCDLAIKINDKVQFLIESKAIGIELKDAHMKQACDYGANHGVQWIILTNGIIWKIYRIRFEQPINYDLVYEFDFMSLNQNNDQSLEYLFVLSKEGLEKNVREIYYEKAQNVNRFVIGNLILTENVLSVICRDLRKITDGIKIRPEEIEQIIKVEVLKRDIIESETGKDVARKIAKQAKREPRKIKQDESNSLQEEKVDQSVNPDSFNTSQTQPIHSES